MRINELKLKVVSKLKEKDFRDLYFLGITITQLDQIERTTEVPHNSQISNSLSMAFESEIEEVHEYGEEIERLEAIEKKSSSQIVTLTGAVSNYRKSAKGKNEHYLARTV